MNQDETEVFHPTNPSEWRQWLENNHSSKQAVWLVYYKKSANKPTISWSNAVDEALCFGWIDSKKVSIDHEKSQQFFSKRKAKSTWSKINKEKIQVLEKAGKMSQAGLDCVAVAKENGSWTMLDQIDELIIPDDLALALNAQTNGMESFLRMSKSNRKLVLFRLMIAKRMETREKRIAEILALVNSK